MLETARLILIPLTYGQLIKYSKNDHSLESELELQSSSRIISPDLFDALNETIIPNVLRASTGINSNYLFSTLWTMILKSEKRMVGDLCFIGDPNEKGEVEIGYGTYEINRSKGLMTEAVEAMIRWAESQPQVKSIIASTDKINIASSRVLEKNNFIQVGETVDQFQWKIEFALNRFSYMIGINLQPNLFNELIHIRPLDTEDFEMLYAVASDPLIWEQHPNKDRYKKEVFEIFFKGALESKGAFLVYDTRTNAVIGSSRYYDYDREKKSVAIGYTFLARDHWGTMFNRALKTMMLDHAFKFVDIVIFHIGALNIRSQRAIEKLGAVKTNEIEVAYYGEPSKLNFEYQIKKSNWV
jgi:RimJ/RimL family protein N-acetyltransferase